MTRLNRLGAAFGMTAAAAMAATPAAAADLPTLSGAAPVSDYAFGVFDGDAATADHHRYRRYHRYHRRNRVDAGDVIAGVLVLGGIAAIASAASKKDRERRYRDRDYDQRYNERRDYDRRGDSRSTGSRGLDNAVSQCVSRIERDVRVDQVNSVDRNGEGWLVTGTLYNGEGFSCRIGNNGQIDGVSYAGGYSGASAPVDDNQWSDADYYRARQSLRGPSAEPQPAYPGGPIPDESIDGDLGG